MCCWDKAAPIRPAAPTPSPTVLEKLNKGVREEFERRRRFGNVRPLITTTQNGYRCIAVGSRVYFHQEWRTFTDFLLFYVRDVMGHRWSETEEAKKGFERHPILRWYDRFVEASKTARHEEGGIVSAVLDGLMAALVLLAYDLYVLRDHQKLQVGFVETDTENEQVLTPFLRSLVERGLDVSQGLLVIVDGGKGLRAAVRHAFRHRALVQQCQWHKRENVVSYLAKREQPVWRQRLQRAYNRPEYDEALAALQSLQHELEDRNQSAAGNLAEGLDETLTLHRLGVYGVLGRSLKTTNGLESINALIEERCAKVDHWQNSSQRQRWLATALLDIEPRLRKVMSYRHLPRLRDALKRELKIDTTTSKTKAA